MTGADADVDGFAVARALERRSIEAARAMGYRRAVTICTNLVTAHIAIEELGFERLAAIPYASFEVEGRAVFAEGATLAHREAVLLEKWL